MTNFGKYWLGVPLKIEAAQNITNEFWIKSHKSNSKPSLIEANDGKEFEKKLYTELLNENDIKSFCW